MRWSSFRMRYAISCIICSIPRWRCPALIKDIGDVWRRVRRCYISDPRVVRAAQNAGGLPRSNGRRRYRWSPEE